MFDVSERGGEGNGGSVNEEGKGRTDRRFRFVCRVVRAEGKIEGKNICYSHSRKK